MLRRLTFFESISGIQYPEMLVIYFDHFIALKQLVEDTGKVTVISNTDTSITFSIKFNNAKNKDKALSIAQSGVVVIYGRTIQVQVNILSETEIEIVLQ